MPIITTQFLHPIKMRTGIRIPIVKRFCDRFLSERTKKSDKKSSDFGGFMANPTLFSQQLIAAYCFATAIFMECSISLARQYSIQNLGDFIPNAINNSSQITGGSETYVAFWENGTLTQLSPPGLTFVAGETINSSGEIVGNGSNRANIETAFTWSPAAGFSLIAPPGYTTYAIASNDNGDFAGAVEQLYSGQPNVATIWNSQKIPTYLPALSDGDSTVLGINDLGQAVGRSGSTFYNSWPENPVAPYGMDHAVLWENGNIVDMTPNDPESQAFKINDNGQVIGELVDPSSGVMIPFEWDADHGLTELPVLGAIGGPDDINNEDQIVGWYSPDEGTTDLACIWEHGTVTDLNNLLAANSGWVLTEADAINDSGDIVGFGTYDGQNEGFLLTPDGAGSIPEPSVLILAAGFPMLFRRRNRNLLW